MNWYLTALKKYAEFSGRSRRKEYWFFVLFNFLIYIALGLIDYTIGMFSAQRGIGLLSGIYNLAVLIPGLAVLVRRLHDTGRSGWWFFISFIPCIGGFVLLYFLIQESQRGANEYGANPIEITEY